MVASPTAPSVNLSLLSVLVVEDIGFIRLLLVSVLRAMGIEQVHMAENGGEAVKMMEARAKTLPEGTPPYDIVVSDLLMPEVDGFMLLRWIRTGATSPERFLPVAMISGAADLAYVQKTRDLGANEFIAKPFSSQAVWDRLMNIIYKPRRYVLGGGYFGPERRRVNRPVEVERRLRKQSDIQVVRNSTKKINVETADVIYFELSNRLAGKVGGLPQGAEMPKIDPDVLKVVEGKIQDMAGDYATWIADEIIKMDKAIHELRAEGANKRDLLSLINRLAHEMRGQGGLFGYPLITEVAKSLFLYTQNSNIAVTPNEFELIKAHGDAIRVVVAERIEGDGGEVGRALLAGLQAAIKKFTA